MAVPFANILHAETIRRLAGDRAFERGRAYFDEGRVRGLVRDKGTIGARVKGVDDYSVRIWVREDNLAYACSCPQGKDQAFCKHAVALGLAWLDRSLTSSDRGPDAKGVADDALRTRLREALRACTHDELIELACDLVLGNDEVRRRLLGPDR